MHVGYGGFGARGGGIEDVGCAAVCVDWREGGGLVLVFVIGREDREEIAEGRGTLSVYGHV